MIFHLSIRFFPLTDNDMQHTESLVSKTEKIYSLHDILQPGRYKVGYRAKNNTEKLSYQW